jgi:hypothetical protein
MFYIRHTLEENGNTMKQCVSYYTLKKANDSVRRDILYHILKEFGIPMKLVMQASKRGKVTGEWRIMRSVMI